MYVVVRGDLPSLSYMAVQAAHALTKFIYEHPTRARSWFSDSETLVFLRAPDADALRSLMLKLDDAAVQFSVFYEEDLPMDKLTAVAVAPEGAKLLRRYPLL